MKQKPAFFHVMLFLFLFIGCGTNHQVNKVVEYPGKIIFMNFKMLRPAHSEVQLSLMNTIISEGKVKENSLNSADCKPGNLVCMQQNADHHVLARTCIDDPLKKTFEYSNEAGELQKKTLDLDSNYFSVRMNLQPTAKYITLHLIDSTNNPSGLLLNIEL